jgi:8-oxo-dGTP diphosphatase
MFFAEIHATLMFIVKDGQILLIEKKRGHGEGKVNGPGGKMDPGESPLECAIRETQEELCISVKEAHKVAELWFEMSDYPNLLCHVFLANDFEGQPTETDEAVPLWASVNSIPYERMWADDRHWLPLILGGKTLLGKFTFEGDHMLSKHVEEQDW